jgi:hypothetical protein
LNDMALPTSIAAESRGSIGIFIPQIVDLLKNKELHLRRASAEALLKLSEQGMHFIWSSITFR